MFNLKFPKAISVDVQNLNIYKCDSKLSSLDIAKKKSDKKFSKKKSKITDETCKLIGKRAGKCVQTEPKYKTSNKSLHCVNKNKTEIFRNFYEVQTQESSFSNPKYFSSVNLNGIEDLSLDHNRHGHESDFHLNSSLGLRNSSFNNFTEHLSSNRETHFSSQVYVCYNSQPCWEMPKTNSLSLIECNSGSNIGFNEMSSIPAFTHQSMD